MNDLQQFMSIYFIVLTVFLLGLGIYSLIGYYKLFDKAGFPGWLSLVPILNIIITFKIAKMSPWWFFVLFVPFVNLVLLFVYTVKFVYAFGKDSTYALLSILFGFITIPWLGYSDAFYNEY